MSSSLDAAVSGMIEQQHNLELIANNLANVSTTGYKRLAVHFQDVLNDAASTQPNATDGGAGVVSTPTTRAFLQGSLTPTGRNLDFAISGDGFFRVKLEDGTTAYTRDGTFGIGVNGQLTTADGYAVDPPMTVPVVFDDLKLGSDGTVSVRRPLTAAEIGALKPGDPRDGKQVVVGQLQLSRFPNPAGLDSIGHNLFVETPASQAPIDDNPNANGMGTVYSGWLEASNVDVGLEMTNLSLASRSYSLNFTAFRTIDDMMRQAGQIT